MSSLTWLHSVILLPACLQLAWMSVATAAPSLGGVSGGIDFPTSAVLPEARMSIGVGYTGGQSAYVLPPFANRFYFLTTQLLPGLEVNARFTEVLGLNDPTIALPYYVDRMVSAKWQLPLPEGWPLLSVGGIDVFSINDVNRVIGHIPGSSRYGASAYGVLGHQVGPVQLDLGYGYGKSYLQGPFVVASMPVTDGLEACLEYGASRFNVGLGYSHPAGLSVRLAWLQGTEVGVATTYNLSL